MSGENASDQGAAEGGDQGSQTDAGQSAEANAAAASARREASADNESLRAEIADLRERMENGNNQSETEEDHSLSYDDLGDPEKMQAEIKRQASELSDAGLAKLRKELDDKDAQARYDKAARGIQSGFEIFNDGDYGQDAKDMLQGRLSREEGEITEEVYKGHCAEVAKRVSKSKAEDGNAEADKKTKTTTPPPNGSGAAMGVNTDTFADPKMTADERSQAIRDKVSAR